MYVFGWLQKKTPEAGLYHSMIEAATLLGTDTLLGSVHTLYSM